MRGNVAISDVSRNVARLRSTLRMARWNTEGFKARSGGAPSSAAASALCRGTGASPMVPPKPPLAGGAVLQASGRPAPRAAGAG